MASHVEKQTLLAIGKCLGRTPSVCQLQLARMTSTKKVKEDEALCNQCNMVKKQEDHFIQKDGKYKSRCKSCNDFDRKIR